MKISKMNSYRLGPPWLTVLKNHLNYKLNDLYYRILFFNVLYFVLLIKIKHMIIYIFDQHIKNFDNITEWFCSEFTHRLGVVYLENKNGRAKNKVSRINQEIRNSNTYSNQNRNKILFEFFAFQVLGEDEHGRADRRIV